MSGERPTPHFELSRTRQETAIERTRETTETANGELSQRTRETPRATAEAQARAVDSARVRAQEAAERAGEETEDSEKENIFERAGRRVRKASDTGYRLGSEMLLVTANMGYFVGRRPARGALRLIDWFGRKLDAFADKHIDKKIPVLKYVVNPMVSLLDWSAKSLGLDKSLAEYFKKHDEARKKMAEKLMKDYQDLQKRYKQKADEAAKKASREKKIKELFGDEAASVLIDEIKTKEKEESKEEKKAE